MMPLLITVSDAEEWRLQDVANSLAEHFSLDDEERLELLPSGQAKFRTRVNWASQELKKHEFIKKPRWGHLQITELGLSILRENPSSMDSSLLDQYTNHGVLSDTDSKAAQGRLEADAEARTPSEVIEAAYQMIRDSLAEELLQQIKNCSPEFFERLVVDVLVSMGYGGTRREAGRAIGKSGDEGIDGTINEDRLGLDVIYIQAKRWEGTVSRPHIQQFAGALQGQKARKGVFITTSNFSKGAKDFARNIESSLVLVDGEVLAGHMIDHSVGVTVETSYEIKRIDSDYFEEV